MTVRKTTYRPNVSTWVQWTGDNLAEVEEVMGRHMDVDANNELILMIFSGFAFTVAIGAWCSPSSQGTQTTANLDLYQQITGNGPYAYTIVNEAS
jgi:hypothetical protein